MVTWWKCMSLYSTNPNKMQHGILVVTVTGWRSLSNNHKPSFPDSRGGLIRMATGFPVAKASNVLMTRYLGSSSSTILHWFHEIWLFSGRLRGTGTSHIYWNIPIFMKRQSSNMVAFSFKITHKIHQTLPKTSDKNGPSLALNHTGARLKLPQGWFWLVCLMGVRSRYPWYGFTVRWKFGTSWDASNTSSIQHSTNNHIIVWVTKFGTWQREYP